MENYGLTKKEEEIYNFFVFRGGKRKDAAKHFCVSVYTIKTHLKSIYLKLGIHSLPEIIRHYYENKDLN